MLMIVDHQHVGMVSPVIVMALGGGRCNLPGRL